MSKSVKGRPEVDFVATTFIRTWGLIRAYGFSRFLKNLSEGNIIAFNQVVANATAERENIANLVKKARDTRKKQSVGGKVGAQRKAAKRPSSANAPTVSPATADVSA